MKTNAPLRLATASLLLLLGSALPLFADYSNTVGALNPLAYWRFSETAASPPLNKVVNSSSLGSILNGYVVADATLGEAGIVGNSVRLINPGSAAGYASGKIDVPFNAALNKPGAFTLEFWAKPASLADTTGMAVISSMMNDFAASARIGYLVYVNQDGRFEFRQGSANGYVGTVNTGSSPQNATTNGWTHVVCTFDGSQSRIYLQGQLAATLNLTAAQIAALQRNSQMPFRIGGTPFNGTLSADDIPWPSAGGVSGNRCFDGWVDEVAYYGAALSEATVAAHHAAASTNSAGYAAQILADNPVGYWGLNEAAAVPPDPATLPIAANSGSLGSAVDGTNMWGVLAGQDGPPYAGFGAGNKAILNDGVSGGYLGLPNDPGLAIAGNITLMAWIKPTAKNYFRDIIANGWVMPLPGGGADYQETFLRIGRGGANGGLGSGNFYEVGVTDGATDTYYHAATIPMPDGDLGNWVFLAGTYDGANWKLYRNGALVATFASANGALNLGARWSVGSRSDASAVSSMYFPGFIDEAAIFNTALSAAQINSIYNEAQGSPVITRAVTAPATAFKNSSLDLSVWAEGSPTLGYQWTSNGVSLGVTTTNVTVNNLQVGNQTFEVIVTNPYGSVTSSVTVAVSAAPPSISVQPQSVSRYLGSPFNFSVTAGGTVPLVYQWSTNGTPIPGATSSTYGGTASAALAGSYTCAISNETGVTVTSAPATLTVLPSPSGYGGAVLGSSPIAYWRLGEASGAVGNDYVGGINGNYVSATLGQPGYAPTDPDTAVRFDGPDSYLGSISGTAVNFEGTTTSFSLECWANGAAGQADESTLIAKGTGADGTTGNEQFSLDITGGKYRFFVRAADLASTVVAAPAAVGPNGAWQHIVCVYDASVPASPQMSIYVNGELSGSIAGPAAGLRVSSAPVSIGAKRGGNAPTYNVAFRGTMDEVAVYDSALSLATVQAHYAEVYGANTPPAFDLQPKSATNYAGLGATFSASAYGTAPISYQWKKGAVLLVDGGNISGANGPILTISPLALGDAGSYSLTANNSANGGSTTNSATAVLTVLTAPTNPPAIAGLVVHLPFDGNLNDLTGRGNNGTGKINGVNGNPAATPTGNAAFHYTDATSPGVIGKALHYSTVSGGTTNYVTLGVRDDLKFGSTVNFSISYWFRFSVANEANGDLPFFCNAINSYGNPGYTFAPSYKLGGWSYSLNGVVQLYGPDNLVNDGLWHHLVHTFDRAGSAITYLDGVQADSRPATTAGDVDTANAVTIGQDPTGNYPEEGNYDIDDLGVWKAVLTPLEAASIYMAGASNGVSFTDAPLGAITIGRDGNNVSLSWTNGFLQSANTVNGEFTDVPGATSPYSTPPTGAQKYFRLRP